MLGTVLVVEDNPITRKLVRVTLAAEGYEVVEADSGSAAVEVINRQRVDLVLQDLTLSDMDGFELVGRLQNLAEGRDTPILAFTGNANTERVREAGFVDHLLKPVTPSRLVRAVRAQLGGAQHQLARSSAPATGESAMRERAWRAVGAMLARLTELTGSSHSVADIVADVLVTFLDASGFAVGAAYTIGPAGEPTLRTQLGFTATAAAGLYDLKDHCEHQGPLVAELSKRPGVASDVSCCVLRIFDQAGAPSVMTVPLAVGERPIGMLVLGSSNPEVPAEWGLLAQMVVGPIAQAVALAETIERLSASEHKFRGIAESTVDGILVTDALGVITYVNPPCEEILATKASTIVGRRIDSIVPFLASGAWQGELVRPSGRRVPVETSAREFEDPPGHTNRVYAVRDLSERARIEELAHLASHDALTGMFNRRRFGDEFASRLADARRYGTSGALLVIDLDRFKPINDTFGHQAGDVVLRAVAEVLRNQTRESDTAARLGGDEFAILAHHTIAAGAQALASKILEGISALAIPFEGHTLSVGASIGVALFPAQGCTADTVFAAADEALYDAKHAGRSQVSISGRISVAPAVPLAEEEAS